MTQLQHITMNHLSFECKSCGHSPLIPVQEAGVVAYLDWSGGTTSQDTTGFSFFPATGADTVVKVRTKLVEAGYVTLSKDLMAASLNAQFPPAVAQEFMSQWLQTERKRDINSYRINEMPLFDDLRLNSALFVDAQRPHVMVNKPEKYSSLYLEVGEDVGDG